MAREYVGNDLHRRRSVIYELAPPENTDWVPAHWNYEDVARKVDRLAGELELLRGGRAAYQIGYRSFSGRLGAHPTWRLLDIYIGSTTGTTHCGPTSSLRIRTGVRASTYSPHRERCVSRTGMVVRI